MGKTAVVFFILFAAANAPAAEDVYKWKDEKGQWKFSNTPPPPEHNQSDTIAPLSQDGGNCTPFTMGEARELKSPRSSNPDLQIIGVQVKLVDVSNQVAKFSWKLQLRNLSNQTENVTGNVNFLDCTGFLLGRGSLNATRLAAGQTIELAGDGSTWGKMAHNVGRFNVELSGMPMTSRTQQSVYPSASGYTAPRMDFGLVRLLWSRLEGVVGESYVAGEVVNSGPGTANNVAVKVTVTSRQGTVAATGTAEVEPATLPPGARGSFRQRVTILAIEGHRATVEPQWWPRPGMMGYGGGLH